MSLKACFNTNVKVLIAKHKKSCLWTAFFDKPAGLFRHLTGAVMRSDDHITYIGFRADTHLRDG
jgi:hypothetical protein